MVRRTGRPPKSERAVDHTPRALGNYDVRRRPSGVGDRRAARPRRADDGPKVPRLRRAVPRAGALAGRRRGDGQPCHPQGARSPACAIAADGTSVLYLPPYRPDLDPIEVVYAELKALLRKPQQPDRGIADTLGERAEPTGRTSPRACLCRCDSLGGLPERREHGSRCCLRHRVVQAIEDGLSCRQAAARFDAGGSSAIRWHRAWCRNGSFAPKRLVPPQSSPSRGDLRRSRCRGRHHVA